MKQGSKKQNNEDQQTKDTLSDLVELLFEVHQSLEPATYNNPEDENESATV